MKNVSRMSSRLWSRAPKKVAVLGILLSALWVVPAVASASRPAARSDVLLCHGGNYPMARAAPGPYGIGVTEVVDLVSDLDGETIHVGVVRPDVPEATKVPVIVVATPYLNHNLDDSTVASCYPRIVDNYVQHGYAVGFVAVRGTSGSGGCSDLTGPAERADIDQAITWFGEQPWSTGRVGMIGVSYDGATAWEAAATGNKHLKTIVPISGVNDFFDLLYRYGVPEYRSVAVMPALYYLYPFFPGDVANRPPVQIARSAACPEFLEGVAASLYSASTGERDPLGYWAERNSRPGVQKNYRGTIFLARGLQDWNVDPAHDFPWVTKLERTGIYVKYMLGQWEHHYPDSTSEDEVMEPGEPVRWDWADILLTWWDRWLKEKPVKLGPRAQVQDSSGAWRNEKAWPPADAVATDYFLTADERLATAPSPSEERYPIVFDGWKQISDAPTRPCVCARFTLRPMTNDLRFAGIPELNATVTPLGAGGHISAYLYAGSERVGWGTVDLRFAQGGEKAQLVVPGQPMVVRVPLEPLDVVIKKGTVLTLVVAQSGHGGNGTLTYRNSAAAFPLQLHVGDKQSRLTLSTFTRGYDSFFTPPKTPRPAS